MLKIESNILPNGYNLMIKNAKENLLRHTSHQMCKLNIYGEEKVCECVCEGIKIDDGMLSINREYIPPKMKYAFIYKLPANALLMAHLSKEKEYEIDNKRVYISENDIFNEIRFITYDLVEGE